MQFPDFFTKLMPVIDSRMLWIVFVLTAIVFGITSLILEFHWIKYGRRSARIILAEIVYFAVGIFILASAVAAIQTF